VDPAEPPGPCFGHSTRDERLPVRPVVTEHAGTSRRTSVGIGLARLEGAPALTALLERVERFELSGAPVRKLNNLIRSFASLPVRIRPA